MTDNKETTTPQGLWENGLPVKTTGKPPSSIKKYIPGKGSYISGRKISRYQDYLNKTYGKSSPDAQAFKSDTQEYKDEGVVGP